MRPEFEAFLARLYTDEPLRARFLADPRAESARHQLTAEECDALERIDRVGLELSARSFAHKRALKKGRAAGGIPSVSSGGEAEIRDQIVTDSRAGEAGRWAGLAGLAGLGVFG